MLNEIDQDGTDFALQQIANTPRRGPAAPAKFSVWGMTTAAPRGAAAAVNEMAAFGADVTGALGTFNLATNVPEGASVLADAGVGFGAPEDVRRQAQADVLSGNVGSTELGDTFRDFGRWYRPDPVTAHTAERLVFDFSRFATKAVGYSLATGPFGGAALTGGDEGMVAADDLKQEGVDAATRVKVAAVTAATAAAGVALPVAGKTIAGTIGLTAVGGPISFAGQQLATRNILENAGYDKLAEQYDPLDPVGLFVSTLVPAGFGAFALRGAARRARAAEAARAEAIDVAPQETQVSQAVAEAYPRETVDAARVRLISEDQQAKSLVDQTDARGVVAEAKALELAAEQLARGDRVNVTEVAPRFEAPVTDSPSFRNWFGESKVVDDTGKPLVVYHGTAGDFDSFELSRQGTANGLMFARGIYLTADPGYAGMMASRADEGGNVMPAYVRLQNPRVFDSYEAAHALSTEEWRSIESGGVHDGVMIMDGGRASEVIAFRPEQIKSAIGNSGRFDPNSGSLTDPLGQFAGQMVRAMDDLRAEVEKAGLFRQPRPEKTEPANADQPAADARPAETVDQTPTDTPPASLEAAAAETSMAGARLAEIQRDYPDLEVMMDGMEKPMRLSDFLQEVRAAADEELAEAPLYDVAVQCALTNGL